MQLSANITLEPEVDRSEMHNQQKQGPAFWLAAVKIPQKVETQR